MMNLELTGSRSLPARLVSALRLDAALYREVERDPAAIWQAAFIVLLAGAGRGASPLLEAGWRPVAGHAVAALLTWLVVSGLLWNVAHRLLGFREGYRELARVLGFAGAPLIGLWLCLLPLGPISAWVSAALHGLAFASLVIALRASLETSLVAAIGICALAILLAALIFLSIGVFLVGSPAAHTVSSMHGCNQVVGAALA